MQAVSATICGGIGHCRKNMVALSGYMGLDCATDEARVSMRMGGEGGKMVLCRVLVTCHFSIIFHGFPPFYSAGDIRIHA